MNISHFLGLLVQVMMMMLMMMMMIGNVDDDVVDGDDDDDSTEARQPSQPSSWDWAKAAGCRKMAGIVLQTR